MYHVVDALTCVIDQDVKPLLSLEEALTEFPYRAQVGQIQLHVQDVKVVTLELDLPHSLLSLVHVSASDNDTGASHCQGNSCLLANARIPTCKEKMDTYVFCSSSCEDYDSNKSVVVAFLYISLTSSI